MEAIQVRLAKRGSAIRSTVIGIGSIGRGLAHQCHITPGFDLVAVADLDISKAIAFAESLGLPFEIVETEPALATALVAGTLAVSADSQLVAGIENVEVMIDATNAVYPGALNARRAFAAGTHVVSMNFEIALMYGPLLQREAAAAGVVYACADGDQPTVIKQMVDDISFWGFEIVMMGNIKGYHDAYTNPTLIAPEADKRNLDHKMCSSYTDGSKLCVEMAALANAMNGRVTRPGMLGPRMEHVRDIYDHMDFAGLWQPGDRLLVDYVVGAKPYGGVFVIAYNGDPFQQFSLGWFPPDFGPGPHYLFYRPYHLCHIEALKSVAEAVMDGSSIMPFDSGMRTNVYCYAKTDLKAGDRLDGMGGYTTYGLIENIEDQVGEAEGVPQLLCSGMEVTRDHAKDEKIRLADCRFDPAAPGLVLYREALAL